MTAFIKNTLSVLFVCLLCSQTSSAYVNTSLNKNFKIMLDPGEGLRTNVYSSPSGLAEYKANLEFANELKQKLEKVGFTVAITHDASSDPSDSERSGKAKDYNLLLSIHHDGLEEKNCDTSKGFCMAKSDGYSIFVSKNSSNYDQSLELADSIGRGLSLEDFKRNDYHRALAKPEVIDADLSLYALPSDGVLDGVSALAIKLEVGVVTSTADQKILTDKLYRSKMQKVIVETIMQYRSEQGE